jgi:hypothetical protein
MKTNLFTTLTANEEANLSGGKSRKSVKVTVRDGSAINGSGAVNGSSSVNGGPDNAGEITPGDSGASNRVSGGINVAVGVGIGNI